MPWDFNFTSHRAKVRIDRILKLLEGETLTAEQISIRLYAAKSSIHKYLSHLHGGQPKRLYIVGYDTSGFRPVAMYAAGAEEDAPKPKKDKAQIWQETKADPKKLARVHEIQAALRSRRRGGIPPARTVRSYDPPLEQQVQKFIEVWPGMTSRQIAVKLNASLKVTKETLTTLRKNGLAHYKRRTRDGALWESTAREITIHPPVVTKPQNPFSALGI